MLQEELRSIEYDLHGIFDDKELEFLTADLGAINLGVFVEDLDSEVAKQSEETLSKVEEVDNREVPVAKALGFKSISAMDEKHVAGFIAILEEQFGLDAQDSFVAFAKQMVASY
jgi:translation elongation factor EF-1beta